MSDPNDVMMQEFDLEVCLDSYSVFNSHEEELNAIELAVDQQHPIYNPEKNKVKRWRHLFYSLSEGLDYYRVTYIQKPVVIETPPVEKLHPAPVLIKIGDAHVNPAIISFIYKPEDDERKLIFLTISGIWSGHTFDTEEARDNAYATAVGEWSEFLRREAR